MRLGVPDNLLRVHGPAIDHCRHLPVRSACVKANAAAVQMPADGPGCFVGFRTLVQRQIHDLHGNFIDVLHKLGVKFSLTRQGICRLQPLSQGTTATDINPETTHRPQQKLYKPLHIAVVRLRHLRRAVDLRMVHRNMALIPLHCNRQRLLRPFLIGLHPSAKGDKLRIQLGQMSGLVGYT